MKNITYLFFVVLLFFNVNLIAQNCDYFDNQDIGNWTGIDAIVINNNEVLDVTDDIHESWVINTSYNSNSAASSYCYSYNLQDDGHTNTSSPLTTQLYIFTEDIDPNFGLYARFELFTPINENSGWQNIIVPIIQTQTGTPLPSNGQGQWFMNDPTQWNTLIQSYVGVGFRVDVVGSTNQTENFLLDNFCTGISLDVDFSVDTQCENGEYIINVSAIDNPSYNYDWTLMQTSEPNETSGGQVDTSIQNGSSSESFSGLDVSNYYYVELLVQSNQCANPTTSVQSVPYYTVTSDFFLLDQNENPTNEFCYTEDIFIDGSNSEGGDNYKFYVKRRPSPNPNNVGWSQYADFGWVNSEVGVHNLSEIFEQQDYHFLAGFEYSISVAVQNTSECINWVVSEKSFTVECCGKIIPDLNANFDIAIKCAPIGYFVGAAGFPQNFVTFHWTIYQTDTANSTTGGTVVYSGSGPEDYLDFIDILERENFYYMQLTVVEEICQNSVTSTQVIPHYKIGSVFHFEDEDEVKATVFCYGQDVILNGEASYGEDNHYIGISRRPYPEDGTDFSYFGSIGWAGGPAGSTNLSEAFANSGLFFEPGFEYKVGLAVQNNEECVDWVVKHESFVVKCCDDFLSAAFALDPSPISSSDLYSLTAVNIFEFLNISVEHKWYLISTPDLVEGPYTVIATQEGNSFYYEVEQGLCYKVIHSIKTDCGEFCFAQNVCINLEKDYEEQIESTQNVGVIDCDFIDKLCLVPSNLDVTCSNTIANEITISWDEVEAASNYMVQLTYNDPICCNSKNKPFVQEYELNTNSLNILSLPLIKPWDCFSWKVKSNCSDWSESICFTSCPGKRSIGISLNLEGKVFPNPTNNSVRISFEKEFTGVIQMMNLKGEIIEIQKYEGVQFVDYSLIDQASGVYVLLVKDNTGSYPFKIIKY